MYVRKCPHSALTINFSSGWHQYKITIRMSKPIENFYKILFKQIRYTHLEARAQQAEINVENKVCIFFYAFEINDAMYVRRITRRWEEAIQMGLQNS